jgi:hypothetical protein
MNHSIPQQQLPLNLDQVDSAWQVRISQRTRRLSVRVYPAGNVVVVAPKYTSAKLIQDFIAKHRDWINVRVQECTARQLAMVPPTELILPAIEQFIRIEYRQESARPKLKSLGHGQLLLRGHLTEPSSWSRLITTWLTELAQQELELRLRKLATSYGFSYDRLQIRRQRTRWGSCAASGTISLNLCAMFLRPEVLRYLMIHELCHTRHMNHSKQFWSLVESCQPDYLMLDKELSNAWKHVPSWIMLSK